MIIGEKKEVVVHDVVGGVSNGRNEKREEDSHERTRKTAPIGKHLRTKAEALEYLADLSHYPNLANWLAAEARKNEARKLRRNSKRKREGQVAGIGTSEVSEPENGIKSTGVPEEHLQTDDSLESLDAKLQKQQKVSEDSAPFRKDSVSEFETAMARKRYRSKRYFDTQDRTEPINNSGEDDDNIHLQKQRQKQKPKVCSNCGHHGHKWKKCKKVNGCSYCEKKGHLPQNCPREDIVRERTNTCLKCKKEGHDMFSCTNDYPEGDLEEIQCYVCKEFGHLCCAKYENRVTIPLSCYNCGEYGHRGPECNKVQQIESRSKRRKNRKKRKKLQEDDGSPSASVHSNSRDEGHPGQERHKKAKLGSSTKIGTNSHCPNSKAGKSYQPINYIPRFQGLPILKGGHRGQASTVPTAKTIFLEGNRAGSSSQSSK